MPTFKYIMPDERRGRAGKQTTIRFKPEIMESLQAHTTIDPATGKKVTVNVLIHNAIVGGDPHLMRSIRAMIKNIKRSKKDGANT